MGNASGLRFGVAYGAVVNVILWSYELKLFFRYVSTGLQHASGRQEMETLSKKR